MRKIIFSFVEEVINLQFTLMLVHDSMQVQLPPVSKSLRNYRVRSGTLINIFIFKKSK